jgi:hypothetical protein
MYSNIGNRKTIPKNWSIFVLPLPSTNVINHCNGREKLNKKLSKGFAKQMLCQFQLKPEQTRQRMDAIITL